MEHAVNKRRKPTVRLTEDCFFIQLILCCFFSSLELSTRDREALKQYHIHSRQRCFLSLSMCTKCHLAFTLPVMVAFDSCWVDDFQVASVPSDKIFMVREESAKQMCDSVAMRSIGH